MVYISMRIFILNAIENSPTVCDNIREKEIQMINDYGLLIGLISIALSLFLGLYFGLAGFRKGVTSELSSIKKDVITELSSIKEAVIAVRTTVEKTWDLIVSQFGVSGGTIERELENLGNVKITAEPGAEVTTYLIEIEKAIMKEGPFFKKAEETDFVKQETEILGGKTGIIILSPHRMRYSLPSTDPEVCTEFITFFLNWLNSTYFESLEQITEFEESILT